MRKARYYKLDEDQGFKFQDYVCNGCQDLSMLYLNISDIAIITVKKFTIDVYYGCLKVYKCWQWNSNEKSRNVKTSS